MAVVFLHLGSRQFSHGFLAVDFFFALSGFVIAHAYEERFRNGMSFGAFVRVRLIRLYPLMLLGTLIGTVVCALQGVDLGFIAYVGQLTWLPLAVGGTALFPVNNIQWSLTLEAGANIAHALVLRKLPEWALGVLMAAGLIGLVATAWRFGTLNAGWGHSNWMGGVARLGFSYPLGVLAFRLHQRGSLPNFSLPFPVLAIALLATMVAASSAGSA
jgi:peptidoglycan/LPS O-acetylase OafA/YrhL